jgi:hypothetical protein
MADVGAMADEMQELFLLVQAQLPHRENLARAQTDFAAVKTGLTDVTALLRRVGQDMRPEWEDGAGDAYATRLDTASQVTGTWLQTLDGAAVDQTLTTLSGEIDTVYYAMAWLKAAFDANAAAYRALPVGPAGEIDVAAATQLLEVMQQQVLDARRFVEQLDKAFNTAADLIAPVAADTPWDGPAAANGAAGGAAGGPGGGAAGGPGAAGGGPAGGAAPAGGPGGPTPLAANAGAGAAPVGAGPGGAPALAGAGGGPAPALAGAGGPGSPAGALPSPVGGPGLAGVPPLAGGPKPGGIPRTVPPVVPPSPIRPPLPVVPPVVGPAGVGRSGGGTGIARPVGANGVPGMIARAGTAAVATALPAAVPPAAPQAGPAAAGSPTGAGAARPPIGMMPPMGGGGLGGGGGGAPRPGNADNRDGGARSRPLRGVPGVPARLDNRPDGRAGAAALFGRPTATAGTCGHDDPDRCGCDTARAQPLDDELWQVDRCTPLTGLRPDDRRRP